MKVNQIRFCKVIFAASLGFFSFAVAASSAEDHPLFGAYPGAKIRKAISVQYEPFAIPVSVVDTSGSKDKYSKIDTLGNLSQHYYVIDEVSSLKVYENYSAAAKKLGFNTIFSCQLDACGNGTQSDHLGSILSNQNAVYNWYHKPYYFVAEKPTPKGKIVAAWYIGAYENQVAVQQVISEPVAREDALIKVDPSYLTKEPAVAVQNKVDASELARDSKLLARYPNAKLQRTQHVDSEVFTIPVAPNANDKTPFKLTGDLTRHVYSIQDVSTLKVYENYKQALNKAGFNWLSDCKLNECGDERDVDKRLGEPIAINNSVYNWYHKPYYMVAKKTTQAGDIYVALFIGAYDTEVGVQQVVMQTKAIETGLVKVDADSLKAQIDTDGKAAIYGIYFDTGKATLKPESKPTLDTIAQLLNKNKELSLYVVGHTDDTGSNTLNTDLSLQRATSVVNELVNTYKITANRLQAEGVGPYVPVSNNTSEAGKQKNRRVELVKRLTASDATGNSTNNSTSNTKSKITLQ